MSWDQALHACSCKATTVPNRATQVYVRACACARAHVRTCIGRRRLCLHHVPDVSHGRLSMNCHGHSHCRSIQARMHAHMHEGMHQHTCLSTHTRVTHHISGGGSATDLHSSFFSFPFFLKSNLSLSIHLPLSAGSSIVDVVYDDGKRGGRSAAWCMDGGMAVCMCTPMCFCDSAHPLCTLQSIPASNLCPDLMLDLMS